jgi:23S rRNA pseudouridine1911/1915/1917 synthase
MKLRAAPEDKGLRLDQFLAQHLQDVTRSQVQHLNRSGAVRIEGRLEKSGYRIRGGETVEVALESIEPTPIRAEQIPLQIHYEDPDLAVIEKPAGLVVHPGSGVRSGTLVHALLYHFQNLSDVGGEGRPGIVHRIDKKTSGLLIVAKNNRTHALLGRMFQDRKIEKTYIALVHGKFARPEGSVDLPIARHSKIRTRMAAHNPAPHRQAPFRKGRTALTQYKVIENFKEFSLLEVKIQTGRTHQIRVHLSAVGHPVVGDDVYGERSYKIFTKKHGELGRYFLHAEGLRFTHPQTGKELEFHSPLPLELRNLLERIR